MIDANGDHYKEIYTVTSGYIKCHSFHPDGDKILLTIGTDNGYALYTIDTNGENLNKR